MRIRSVIAFGWVFFALGTLLVCPPQSRAQSPRPSQEPKNNEVKFGPHDISGVWNRVSPIQSFGNVPEGNSKAEPAPFTAWGKTKYDSNKPGYGPRAVPPAFGNDPMGTCDPLGIPRLLTLEIAPPEQMFEIIQTSNRVVQLFRWHHDWRSIWADGRKLPDDPDPTWLGTSVGQWDGDSFVVDSTGFDPRSWLDHFGYPHSDEMRLQERYRRVDQNTLELSMTLTDPKAYTKPLVSDTKVFKLNPKYNEIVESYCVPSEEQAFNSRARDVAAGKAKK
jgi:hypothetical protein